MEKKGEYDKLVSLHKEKLDIQHTRRQAEDEEGDAGRSSDVLPIGEGALIIDEVKVRRSMYFTSHPLTSESFSCYIHQIPILLSHTQVYKYHGRLIVAQCTL